MMNMGIMKRYRDQHVDRVEDVLSILHIIFYELFLQ